MPTVPRAEGPQVQTRALRTGQIQKLSPTQLTGAAQQQQQLGQALQRTSATLNEIEVRKQVERNTSQVLAAKTAFEAEAATTLTGAKNTRGANAWGITDKTMAWYEKSSSQHVDNMENEAQKTVLRQIFAEKLPGVKAGVFSHEIGEQRRAVNDSAKAGIQASIDLASANYTDPVMLDQALTDITRTVRVQQATNEGWTKDVADVALMGHTTALHKSVIDAKLDVDPDAAEAHFEKYKDQIQGSEHATIIDGIETGNRRRKAQSFVDEMAAEGKSEEEQLREARKRFEGEDEEEAVAQVTRRFSQTQAAISRDQQAAFREADDILMAEDGSYDQIPNSMLRRLKRSDREALRAEQYGKVTDWPTYYGLRQLAAKDPVTFAAMDLTPHFGKLDAAKRSEIIKLQTTAAKDPTDLSLGRTKWQVLQQAATSAGLDPSDDKKDNSNGEQVRAFYRRVDDELLAHFQRTGKEASQDELIAITDKLTLQVVDTNWWNTDVAAGLIEIEGVPQEQIPDLATAVQGEGMEVTDENIQKLYNYINRGQ